MTSNNYSLFKRILRNVQSKTPEGSGIEDTASLEPDTGLGSYSGGGHELKVLIVSDTHGSMENLEQAVANEAPFDLLIHCGDIEGQEEDIRRLAGCPCRMIAGNNDFFTEIPREEEFMLGGHKVFLTHGHAYGVSLDPVGVLEEGASRDCEIVFFGHTHRPVVLQRFGVTGVNPGSLTYPRQNGHCPSYAVMNVDENGSYNIDIEYL